MVRQNVDLWLSRIAKANEIFLCGSNCCCVGRIDILIAPWNLPEGTSTDVLGFWYPEQTITANDFLCIPKESKAPVLAHRFINYLLDNDVALKNQSYVGYQPALTAVTAEALISSGAIPESLVDAVVDAERYASGQRLVSLSPETDALWNDVWATFTAG